jgi:hypothetical protein
MRFGGDPNRLASDDSIVINVISQSVRANRNCSLGGQAQRFLGDLRKISIHVFKPTSGAILV